MQHAMRFLALSCTTFSVLYFRTSDNNLNQQLINEIDFYRYYSPGGSTGSNSVRYNYNFNYLQFR